jgi:hypothetical protein
MDYDFTEAIIWIIFIWGLLRLLRWKKMVN